MLQALSPSTPGRLRPPVSKCPFWAAGLSSELQREWPVEASSQVCLRVRETSGHIEGGGHFYIR